MSTTEAEDLSRPLHTDSAYQTEESINACPDFLSKQYSVFYKTIYLKSDNYFC